MPGKRSIALLISTILCLLAVLYQYPFRSFAETFEFKFNMSYIYFGDKSTYLDCVENTKGSIKEISPNYFDLNADGSLKITSALDTSFISRMHERGIRVAPFLSNHWNRELGRKALAGGTSWLMKSLMLSQDMTWMVSILTLRPYRGR